MVIVVRATLRSSTNTSSVLDTEVLATEEYKGELPEALRVGGVECVRRDPRGSRLGDLVDREGLVAVFEVAAPDALEQRRGCDQDARGGALLDCLVAVHPGRAESLQVLRVR